MMVEIILFNEIKTPVGASSERLTSESLSRSFKRFIQTADSSDVYAWANETLTQPIRSKHWIIQQWIDWLLWDALWFRQKCKWPNIIVLLIELFIELLNSRNGENVEWCYLTNCILNIKTFHFEFLPQYAELLSVELLSVARFDFSWRYSRFKFQGSRFPGRPRPNLNPGSMFHNKILFQLFYLKI